MKLPKVKIKRNDVSKRIEENKDLDFICIKMSWNSLCKNNYLKEGIQKIVYNIKIDGIEKIQCTPESQNSKIYVCDVLVKYEILTSQNSLSELVGFTGKKSEVKKIRIFKGSSGWEIIG